MRCVRVMIAAAVLSGSLTYAQAAEHRVARLTEAAVPVSYDIDVTPDVRSWTTRGEETILVDVREAADYVTLNWRGIQVSDATIDGATASVESHSDIEQVDIRAQKRLDPGRHVLYLRFVSPIAGFDGSTGPEIEQHGFWNASADEAHPFLVTMFEESTARRMFPCFDEPAFRAPITLHVTAPSVWGVVSNMPVNAKAQRGNTTRWNFAPTPPMPVYLLTLDAGEMSAVRGTSDGVPVTVYTTPQSLLQHGDSVRRTLENAERLLHFYNGYFGVRYPLPKLDIVLAPGILQTALEQWGAITDYAENELLSDNANVFRGKRYAFSILAHEIAHQWFGDLVGMQWWSDTFVAEGLAEWSQQKADASLAPQDQWWEDDDGDANMVMSAGLTSPSVPIVSPIQTDIERDDDVAFGLGVYEKSAAVLRQWELYLGEDRFREAIRRYLRENAGKAVAFDAFWSSFRDPQSRPYGDAWLKRPGFPVLTISASCYRGRDTIELRQDPYRDRRGLPPGYDKQLWPVPVFIRAGSKKYALLMTERSQRVVMASCNEPLAFGSGLRPYYRVRYVGTLYRRIISSLPRQAERDRANALRDALQLFNARYVSAGYLLGVADVARTHDVMVSSRLAGELERIFVALPPGPQRDAVADLTRRVAEPFVVNEMNTAKMNGMELLPALALVGDERIAPEAAQRLFSGPPAQKETFRPYVWFFAALAAKDADDSSISQMSKRDKMEALPYLINVDNPALVHRILDESGGDPDIVFGLARRNPTLVWAYLQRDSALVKSHVPPSQQGWLLAHGTARALWGVIAPQQMKAFLESALGPGYRSDIESAMAQAQSDRRAAEELNRQVSTWCCR